MTHPFLFIFPFRGVERLPTFFLPCHFSRRSTRRLEVYILFSLEMAVSTRQTLSGPHLRPLLTISACQPRTLGSPPDKLPFTPCQKGAALVLSVLLERPSMTTFKFSNDDFLVRLFSIGPLMSVDPFSPRRDSAENIFPQIMSFP